jgi:hypothetical protein
LHKSETDNPAISSLFWITRISDLGLRELPDRGNHPELKSSVHAQSVRGSHIGTLASAKSGTPLPLQTIG